jgi:hypothetical protein
MRVLVLDTIHGGQELAHYLGGRGHFTDTVDVYRGRSGIDAETALARDYDLAVAPVHLDPAHPFLRELTIPIISHHQAVRWILGTDIPSPLVEVTGARGKTTTACALASLMNGPGILHTSLGTFRYPECTLLWRKSITPASLVPAAQEAVRIRGWCIGEVSLGFTGAGDHGIITSGDDYLFAGGRRHAREEKVRSGQGLPYLLVAPGVEAPGAIPVVSVATVQGETCTVRCGGESARFDSPLLSLDGYRMPLMLAAAAGCRLGADPAGLASFEALPGRMAATCEQGVWVVDNANSGTNALTSCQAAAYAREISGRDNVTLVIGQEEGAVCEGFSPGEICSAVSDIRPSLLILIGEQAQSLAKDPACSACRTAFSMTLEEGRAQALSLTPVGSVVLAVKSWR